ncbi:hypothetical protein GCM10010191_74010 [Actinomadura vinacea]|uniref:Uncharacterized protein n=1 Tax=Actinomadura vinacea TaxID=115336 RepID=A0ABN3K1P2_9ACTN
MVAAIPAAIWTINLRVYFLPSGSIMMIWEPVTLGSAESGGNEFRPDGEAAGDGDPGDALAEVAPGAGADGDGAGGLALIGSSSQAAVPSSPIPREATNSRVATFLIAIPHGA